MNNVIVKRFRISKPELDQHIAMLKSKLYVELNKQGHAINNGTVMYLEQQLDQCLVLRAEQIDIVKRAA